MGKTVNPERAILAFLTEVSVLTEEDALDPLILKVREKRLDEQLTRPYEKENKVNVELRREFRKWGYVPWKCA